MSDVQAYRLNDFKKFDVFMLMKFTMSLKYYRVHCVIPKTYHQHTHNNTYLQLILMTRNGCKFIIPSA